VERLGTWGCGTDWSSEEAGKVEPLIDALFQRALSGTRTESQGWDRRSRVLVQTHQTAAKKERKRGDEENLAEGFAIVRF